MLSQLALRQTVVLNERTVGGTNIGATAAFNTKTYLVFFKSGNAVLLVF